MKKHWGHDRVGSWDQINGKDLIEWVPGYFVDKNLIVMKLSENQLNLELISTMSSPTKYFVN